ncbi:Hypothetical protein PFR_JS13-2_1163 [Propionibacterium freudenreichii]|nr:Hypothetical protein PFR_JS11_1174 [Propionibacterium freudenreichii]SCQ48551.1 Hypothetical protein PFR_JS13-1_1174 [Propionibacterium freudenreichii]SCQ53631.1 Hypothetical protein PFR_JS13-2_1163 [Propionibacterium freudenreichii]
MSSRSMRAGAIALAAVMMSSMVACSGPSASEKASASFHNSVSAARDALFEEAKATNRGFFDLEESLGLRGGAEELPPEMHQYVMGDAATSVEALNRDMARSQRRTKSGTKAALIGPRIYTESARSGTEQIQREAKITIERCVDSRESPRENPDGSLVADGSGIVHNILYLKRDEDGTLKIFNGWMEVVETCPINE